MKPDFNKILIRLLSTKLASIVVIIISIAGKVIQKFFFAGLDDDKCYQIQATKNMLDGNSISTYEVFANNLSNPVYTSLIKWPPGYSIILSPFYLANGNNYLWGSLWLDLVAAALFVLLARKIVIQLLEPIWLVNLYTLITGFFFYDFISSNSTDLITLVFFQIAFVLTLKFLRSPDKKITQTILISLFLFCCALLRYMYIPLAIIIPAYFIFSGISSSNKILYRRGILSLALIIFLISSFLIFQKFFAGAPAYLYPTVRGFFPENLTRITPFLFSTVGNLAVPATIFHQVSGIEYNHIATVVIYVHLLLLILLLSVCFYWVKIKRFSTSNLKEHFVNITLLSCLTVLGTLSYLSVTYSSIPLLNGISWTYVSEGRYYATPIFLLQIGLILFLFKKIFLRKGYKNLIIFALAILVSSTLHGFYFTVKKTFEGSRNFQKKHTVSTLDSCRLLFNQFVNKNQGKNIVCASGDPMFNNFASIWENIPGLYDINKLNTMELYTKKETVLFVPVKSWYSGKLLGFLNNSDKEYIGRVNDWTFYTINVKANIK